MSRLIRSATAAASAWSSLCDVRTGDGPEGRCAVSRSAPLRAAVGPEEITVLASSMICGDDR
jgi:hypothetical protein